MIGKGRTRVRRHETPRKGFSNQTFPLAQIQESTFCTQHCRRQAS